MHFWIDKRSQSCGFNARRHIPPSFSGHGRNQRNLCGTLYPKPMVTPVHRFQSIESVANNGVRYTRSPGYNTRVPTQYSSSVHYNGSNGNIRLPQTSRSVEMIPPGHTIIRDNQPHTSKLKCGVWFFFALVTSFLAGAKYYFHGINIGVEVLVFCSLLVIVLIIGGLISLCEAIVSYSPPNIENSIMQVVEQEPDNSHSQLTSTVSQNSSEIPPPPYHIAIMLSPSNNLESVQVLHDSPPPSYDKAVT